MWNTLLVLVRWTPNFVTCTIHTCIATRLFLYVYPWAQRIDEGEDTLHSTTNALCLNRQYIRERGRGLYDKEMCNYLVTLLSDK